MFQPGWRGTLGHLVSNGAGTYNSTIVDIKQNKANEKKQIKGRGLLLGVMTCYTGRVKNAR